MIYVLDATAFIFGFIPSKNFQLYTTEEIIKEIQRNKLSKLKIDTLISQGLIKIISPPNYYEIKVEEKVSLLSESKLSKADKSILALSLFLKDTQKEKITIITDDYSLQNVASALGLEFKSLTVKGITKSIEWIIYCPACGRIAENVKENFCPICGHRMKRKPKKVLHHIKA
ncbi:MAG: NOB1 family endonuclease [Nitrososphaeria archaeon]